MVKQVKCPEGCLLSAGFGKTFEVPKRFKWCEKVDSEIGIRNYCEQCGTKLVEVHND